LYKINAMLATSLYLALVLLKDGVRVSVYFDKMSKKVLLVHEMFSSIITQISSAWCNIADIWMQTLTN